MQDSLKTGISFGITSGCITTLGLMVGLHSGTNSRAAVIGGIITIAVADAFSDSLGIHVSEEAEGVHTRAQIWVATIATFISKFFFALTFVIPVLFLELGHAMIVGIVWGLIVLTLLSYKIASGEKDAKPWHAVAEHLIIALVVIGATHYLGEWIALKFH